MIDRRLAMLAVGLTLLCSMPALACKLPVFRYALERWAVDRYRMVAIVADGEGDSVEEALSLVRAIDPSGINLEVEVIEIAKLTEAELWHVEGFESGTTTNQLQIYYPPRGGRSLICWSGELSVENVKAWVDSPLRRLLVEDLVSGTSAVWIQIDGADKGVNLQVATDLELALKEASKSIVIPEGVIPRAEASQYMSDHPDSSMDDVLRCDVPLRVDFKLRRLSRQEAPELATLAMIDGMNEDATRPILVPVFGRGRMLDAISVDEVDADVILAACRYMVSECSCTVKALNPGNDLLLGVDWQRRLGSGIVMVDPVESLVPVAVAIPEGNSPEAKRSFSRISIYGIGLLIGLSVLLGLGFWKAGRARAA